MNDGVARDGRDVGQVGGGFDWPGLGEMVSRGLWVRTNKPSAPRFHARMATPLGRP
jgi:hypothetical protein